MLLTVHGGIYPIGCAGTGGSTVLFIHVFTSVSYLCTLGFGVLKVELCATRITTAVPVISLSAPMELH